MAVIVTNIYAKSNTLAPLPLWLIRLTSLHDDPDIVLTINNQLWHQSQEQHSNSPRHSVPAPIQSTQAPVYSQRQLLTIPPTVYNGVPSSESSSIEQNQPECVGADDGWTRTASQWRRFAILIDRCFFWLFLLITTCLQIVLVTFLVKQNENIN